MKNNNNNEKVSGEGAIYSLIFMIIIGLFVWYEYYGGSTIINNILNIQSEEEQEVISNNVSDNIIENNIVSNTVTNNIVVANNTLINNEVSNSIN